jgi:hypothetical protein
MQPSISEGFPLTYFSCRENSSGHDRMSWGKSPFVRPFPQLFLGVPRCPPRLTIGNLLRGARGASGKRFLRSLVLTTYFLTGFPRQEIQGS